MFSIFTYIMSRVTHSEPGLPMFESELHDFGGVVIFKRVTSTRMILKRLYI